MKNTDWKENYLYVLILIILMLTSCEKQEYSRPVYFQAAYTFPSCSKYEPSTMTIEISGMKYILDAYKIDGGIKSSSFIISSGTYTIEDISVLDQDNNIILWTPKNIDHEMVVIFTPYTQKIEVGQKMIAGQLDCKI